MTSAYSKNDEGAAIILRESFNAALAGSALAAATTAMLIHLFPEESDNLGIRTKYDNLISQAFASRDPELLVCIAEELIKGEKLAASGELANRFFDKADELSKFMGSYVCGRFFFYIDRRLAIKLFGEGSKAGHIPSMIYRHKLMAKKLPVAGFILRLCFMAVDFVVTWKAIRKQENLAMRFWRYRDCFPDPLRPVDKCIGADRATPFIDVTR